MSGSARQGFRHDRSGASAIEFALICPVLIALVMGIIEFGMIAFSQASAQNAARSIARQIATNKITESQAAAAATKMVAGWVSGSETTSVTQTAPSDPLKNEITVKITFPVTAAAPTQFFARLFSAPLEGRATMQQEDRL